MYDENEQQKKYKRREEKWRGESRLDFLRVVQINDHRMESNKLDLESNDLTRIMDLIPLHWSRPWSAKALNDCEYCKEEEEEKSSRSWSRRRQRIDDLTGDISHWSLYIYERLMLYCIPYLNWPLLLWAIATERSLTIHVLSWFMIRRIVILGRPEW